MRQKFLYILGKPVWEMIRKAQTADKTYFWSMHDDKLSFYFSTVMLYDKFKIFLVFGYI